MAYLTPPIVNTETTDTSFYIIFEDSTTGVLVPRTDSGLTYNPLTNSIITGIGTFNIETGTAPLIISSTTLVSNLNVDLLDGQHGSYYIYTHPTGDGNLHVPATGTTNNGKVLTAGASAGSLSWTTPTGGDNYYPTTFTWTDGTTAGPTGSLTGSGMSAVSYAAIPAASVSTSGIITTGSQEITGSKIFRVATTQDAISIQGRAGGTSSYSVSIVPTTLTANRTLTLPNLTGTVAILTNTTYIGTTSVSLSRSSASLALTGITSVKGTSLTLDSDSTGAVNIGNGANAKTITIGNNTTTTAIDIITGTGNLDITSNYVGISGKLRINTPSATDRVSIKTETIENQAFMEAELLTSSGWTSTNWTGDWTTGWVHTPNYTDALTNSLSPIVGDSYEIAWIISNRTTGFITITFGGESQSNISASGSFGPTTSTSDTLIITPTDDFNGKLIISIKHIFSGSSPTIVLYDSNSVASLEIRNSFGTLGNTFIGNSSGKRNSSGSSNTSYGYASLASNTTGSYNSSYGTSALQQNTVGICNSAYGTYALFTNKKGTRNSAFGYASLQNLTGISDRNVGIGAFSGYYYNGTTGNLTQISNSVFLGYNTSALNAIDDTNETVIGYNAIGYGSNTVTLGNDSIVSTYLKGDINSIGSKFLFNLNATGDHIGETNTISPSNAIIEVERGTAANVYIKWDETAKRWFFKNADTDEMPFLDSTDIEALTSASSINVTDTAAHFTGTTVEDVLAEIGSLLDGLATALDDIVGGV